MSTTTTTGVHRLLDGLDRADVLVAMTPQLPETLVRDVLTVARHRDIALNLYVADLTGEWTFLDATAERDLVAGRLQVIVLAGGVPRRLAPHVDHIPVSLWEADGLLGSGLLTVDLLLARAGRCADGRGTYGDGIGYTRSALATARRVAFEVAPSTSCRPGTTLDLARADLLVEAPPRAPAAQHVGTATPVQRRIAELTAALVPDEATLQLGLGTIPAAVAHLLSHHHDLGLHSGILPGSVQQILGSSVVTGKRKNHQQGQHVATALIGGDPSGWGEHVLLDPVSRTHDPRALLRQHRLWALNSAYQVDLAGQVNAEFAAGARVASGGGQSDFARAAHAGDGASVISLPARAHDGHPRIVTQLDTPVTTPGAYVDAVITEYGVACLTGRTRSERTRALIAIAHPDDRADLAHQITAP